MKTPITYWGGKQQLAKTILELIPIHRIYNELFFKQYTENIIRLNLKINFLNVKNICIFVKMFETMGILLAFVVLLWLAYRDTMRERRGY